MAVKMRELWQSDVVRNWGGAPSAPAASPAPKSNKAAAAPPKAKTKQKRTETPGYKEPSWVRPSTTISATPLHVGSMFFMTKDSTLGSQEEAKLRELAKAYSVYASRQRGLKGEVVGYADPRRSVEPDNKKLSAGRATIVARLLTRFLAAESGLIEGNFDVAVTVGGVLPKVDEDGPELEANSLAPLRRADIFLAGGVIAQAPPVRPDKKVPEKKEPEKQPEPPPLKEIKHDFDDYHIFRGDVATIKENIFAMTVRMYSALGVGGAAGGPRGGNVSAEGVVGAQWTAISLYADFHHRDLRLKFPETIEPRKPSWWGGHYTPTQPDPGLPAGLIVLQDKASRLKIWYLTTIRYADTYILGRGKVLFLADTEIRKDHPDVGKLND